MTLGLPAGTPIQWAGNHRFHHAHADRPGDPHSPARRLLARPQRLVHRPQGRRCPASLYAVAGPPRVLFDGVSRPRSNQQHVGLAADVAADPWYRFVSRPGPYLAFARRARRRLLRRRVRRCSAGPASRRSGSPSCRSSTSATPSTASPTSSGDRPTPGPDRARNHWFLGLPAWEKAGTPIIIASRGVPATASSPGQLDCELDDHRGAARGWDWRDNVRVPTRGADRCAARADTLEVIMPTLPESAHPQRRRRRRRPRCDDFVARAGPPSPTIARDPIPGGRCTRTAASRSTRR